MLDSFLKSLKTKQEHWSVPEGTCTFAEHRKTLKNTSSLSSKQREWDSFRRVYLAIALHRELKGCKSVESGTRMTRIWIPAQLVAQQQWDLPQAPSSFLKMHSLSCRMRGTVTSTSQSCREGWMSQMKHVQPVQLLTPGKWEGGNERELPSSASLSREKLTWHSLTLDNGCGRVTI